jgi:hypothetical protein
MMRVMTTLHDALMELVMRRETAGAARRVRAARCRLPGTLAALPSERLMAAPQNHHLADAESVHLKELKGDPFGEARAALRPPCSRI